jgi:hypothetical protein
VLADDELSLSRLLRRGSATQLRLDTLLPRSSRLPLEADPPVEFLRFGRALMDCVRRAGCHIQGEERRAVPLSAWLSAYMLAGEELASLLPRSEGEPMQARLELSHQKPDGGDREFDSMTFGEPQAMQCELRPPARGQPDPPIHFSAWGLPVLEQFARARMRYAESGIARIRLGEWVRAYQRSARVQWALVEAIVGSAPDAPAWRRCRLMFERNAQTTERSGSQLDLPL